MKAYLDGEKECECEYVSHLPDENEDTGAVPGHDYEQVPAVVQVLTTFGKFWVCAAYAEAGHMRGDM